MMNDNKVIHIRKAVKHIERKDERGKPIPFSARVLKKDGGVAIFKEAVCTSSYHKGTMNFRTPNNEVRKIKAIYIIELNGQEVVL